MKKVFKASSLIRAFIFLYALPFFSQAQSFMIDAPSGSLCAGIPIRFLTSNGGFGTYGWSGNSSVTSSATYTFASAGTYTITATDPAASTATYTLTINPTPAADAGPGWNFHCNLFTGSTVTIGGSPTASGGSPSYSYDWSLSAGSGTFTSATDANPYLDFSLSSFPVSYCVTVTDANNCSASSCANVESFPFQEIMTGLNSGSEGRVPTDMTVDNSINTPYLYVCGWIHKDAYVQNGGPQPKIDLPSLSGWGSYPGLYVAKYDACSDLPLLWKSTPSDNYFVCNSGPYPAWSSGECSQPFTPSIAQENARYVMVAFNANGVAHLACLDPNTGVPLYVNTLTDFIISDLKADANGYLYITGYSINGTGSLNMAGGSSCSSVTFNPWNEFMAQLAPNNSSSTAYACNWVVDLPASSGFMNIGNSNGIPSIGFAQNSAYNIQSVFAYTGDMFSFCDINNCGSSLGVSSGSAAYNSIVTKVSCDGNNAVYAIDGQNIYLYTATYSGTSYSASLAAGPVALATPLAYDLRYKPGDYTYVITYDDLEVFDNSLGSFTSFGTSGVWAYDDFSGSVPLYFSQADGADRCIAADPNNSWPVYFGGSLPLSTSLVSPISYSVGTENTGFISRIKQEGAGFYHPSPHASSVQHINGYNLSLYPDPVQEVLNISIDNGSPQASYRLISADGKELRAGNLSGMGVSNTISTAALSPGIYLVQLSLNGQTSTRKIVKE